MGSPRHWCGVLILVLAASADVLATTYYVRDWGSDTNSGAATSPFRSIRHAALVARNGDTVDVGSGTCADDILVDNADGTSVLRFVASGTDVILPAGTEWQVLRSNNVEIVGFKFNGSTDRCFVWRRSTSGLVQNCEFSSGTKGVKVRSGNVVFDGCKIDSFTNDGMQIFGTSDVTLQSCEIGLCLKSSIVVNANAKLTIQNSTVNYNSNDGVTIGNITAGDDLVVFAISSKALMQQAHDLVNASTWPEETTYGGGPIKTQALTFIIDALNSSWWLDGYHPTTSNGVNYYNKSSSAHAQLNDLVVNQTTYQINDPTVVSNLSQAIAWILAANQLAAQVAIDEAIAGGGSSAEIANAQAEMTAAGVDEAAQQWILASAHYAEAWVDAAVESRGTAYGTTTPPAQSGGDPDNDANSIAIAAREVSVDATTFDNNGIGLTSTVDQVVTLLNTTFSNNLNWGACLWDGSSNLTTCSFTSNGVGGLWLKDMTDSDVQFTGTTLTGNGQYSIYGEDSTINFDVSDTWMISGSDYGFCWAGGALTLNGLTLTNFTIAGISINNAGCELTATGVTLTTNGYGIFANGAYRIMVSGSSISQNSFGIYCNDTDLIDIQSSVISNHSVWGATILATGLTDTTTTFTSCTISNNAGGISVTSAGDGYFDLASNTAIEDNTSTGLHFGRGSHGGNRY
jgi:hypothetical protein